MALTEVTAPAVEPISLDEAKLHLRVDVSDDDDLVTGLIGTARQMAETVTRRALITQTWKYIIDAWPAGDELVLPLPPLQSVASVTYKDEDGDASTLSASSYIVDTDSEPGRIVLATGESWPNTTLYPAGAISVQFTAGYGDAGSDVPWPILQGMYLMIGHLYENREATVGVGNVQVLPLGVEALWWPYRVLRWL